MNPVSIDKQKYLAWPFWVLELSPMANNSDIEKAARDIESKIQFKVPDAEYYSTPSGLCKRDSYEIRDAKAALQDPNSRIVAEYWYLLPGDEITGLKKEEPVSATSDAVELPTPIYKEKSLETLARSLRVWLW